MKVTPLHPDLPVTTLLVASRGGLAPAAWNLGRAFRLHVREDGPVKTQTLPPLLVPVAEGLTVGTLFFGPFGSRELRAKHTGRHDRGVPWLYAYWSPGRRFPTVAHQEVRDWLAEHDVRILRLVSLRACDVPGISQAGEDYLRAIFTEPP